MSVYSKNLSGQRGAIFVANAVAYTAQTTYAAFITAAAEGEIGVFLADGTLKSTALTAGQQFFIAQMRDGLIHKTPILNFNDIYRAAKTIYVAPVVQVYQVGYNGTALTTLGMDFTLAASPPREISISVRNTTPGNQPFPVQEGYAVSFVAGDDQYTRVAQVVSGLNCDFDYEKVSPDRFVYAEILSNGTKVALTNSAIVVQNTNIVTSTAHAQAVGAFLSLRDAVYKVVEVIDANTVRLDRVFQGASGTIAAGTSTSTAGSVGYTSGTTLLGVRLTGLTIDDHFVVTAGGILNGVATLKATTDWKQGSGYGASIQDLEKEGVIFAGVGSTANAAFRADYGYPTLFATAAGTYDQIFVDIFASIKPSAALPSQATTGFDKIIMAAPTGTSPSSVLQTVFGV